MLLLAASLPSFFENEYGKQFHNETDFIFGTGGAEKTKYVGPPSPERYDIGVRPPYQPQKPVFRDPRIIFGLLDGIRPFPVDFYWII